MTTAWTALLLPSLVLCQHVAPRTLAAPTYNKAASAPSAEATYANAYRDIMVNRAHRIQFITAQPLSKPPPSATKQQRREVVAQSFDSLARVDNNAIRGLTVLKPFPAMLSIHKATLELLQTSVHNNQIAAAAFRRGNRKEVDRVLLAAGKADAEAARKLGRTVDKASRDPRLAARDAQLLRQIAQRLTHAAQPD